MPGDACQQVAFVCKQTVEASKLVVCAANTWHDMRVVYFFVELWQTVRYFATHIRNGDVNRRDLIMHCPIAQHPLRNIADIHFCVASRLFLLYEVGNCREYIKDGLCIQEHPTANVLCGLQFNLHLLHGMRGLARQCLPRTQSVVQKGHIQRHKPMQIQIKRQQIKCLSLMYTTPVQKP